MKGFMQQEGKETGSNYSNKNKVRIIAHLVFVGSPFRVTGFERRKSPFAHCLFAFVKRLNQIIHHRFLTGLNIYR